LPLTHTRCPPSPLPAPQLNETFKLFGPILSCKVAQDSRGVSKGYGFVHFETEEAAKQAIENVNGLEWSGRTVECKPYVARNQRQGPEWNNLYVKNVPKEWTERALIDAFSAFGEVTSAVLTTDAATGASRGFGFVCFKNPASAADAEKAMNDKEVDGTPAIASPFKKGEEGAAAGAAADAVAAATTPAAPTKLKLYVGRALKKAERERQLKEKKDSDRAERVASWSKRNLWVCNLDESVDDAVLKREFSKHGTVESAIVARDASQRSRLFGYVLLGSPEEASKAIAAMNKKMLSGKPLSVKLWEPKEAREQRAVQRAARHAAPTAVAGAPGAGGVPGAAVGMPFPPMATPMMQGLMQNYQRLTAMANAGTATPADMAALQQVQMQLMMVYFMFLQQQAAVGAQRYTGAAAAAGRAGTALGAGAPLAAASTAAMRAAPMGVFPGAAPAFNPAMLAGNPAMAAFMSGFPTAAPTAAGVGGVAGGASPSGGRGPRQGGGGGAARGPRGGAAAAAAAAAGTPGRVAVAAPAVPAASGVTASGRPTAAAVVARGVAAPAAGGMAYNAGARNVEDAPSASVPAPLAATAPIVPTGETFTAQLAKASIDQRKQMIGERLFSQIAHTQGSKAGKITGMLLEGMDESELLHLLEAPDDLRARINEALEVLTAAQ